MLACWVWIDHIAGELQVLWKCSAWVLVHAHGEVAALCMGSCCRPGCAQDAWRHVLSPSDVLEEG